MIKGFGYGQQPEAGFAMDSYGSVRHDNTACGFLLSETLSEFSISNRDLNAVSGSCRTKPKTIRYVIPFYLVFDFLETIREKYVVLTEGSDLTNHNSMLYLDLPDYRLFRDHMNGKASRCLIKIKNTSGIEPSMIEIKFRSNKGITGKHLFAYRDDLNHQIPNEVKDKFFQMTDISFLELRPSLESVSQKLVLMGRQINDRVEIDYGFGFSLPGSPVKQMNLPIAVIRISGTQEQGIAAARFFDDRRIRPFSFSRYLLGGSLLLPDQKSNRYKPKILQLQKIMQNEPID